MWNGVSDAICHSELNLLCHGPASTSQNVVPNEHVPECGAQMNSHISARSASLLSPYEWAAVLSVSRPLWLRKSTAAATQTYASQHDPVTQPRGFLVRFGTTKYLPFAVLADV